MEQTDENQYGAMNTHSSSLRASAGLLGGFASVIQGNQPYL